MARLSVAGASVEVDGEGFLVRSDDWTPHVAEVIAQMAGVQMTPDHWHVVNAVREQQAMGRTRLDLGSISARTGVAPDMLHDLFPGAPVDLIARIAGVPRLPARGSA